MALPDQLAITRVVPRKSLDIFGIVQKVIIWMKMTLHITKSILESEFNFARLNEKLFMHCHRHGCLFNFNGNLFLRSIEPPPPPPPKSLFYWMGVLAAVAKTETVLQGMDWKLLATDDVIMEWLSDSPSSAKHVLHVGSGFMWQTLKINLKKINTWVKTRYFWQGFCKCSRVEHVICWKEKKLQKAIGMMNTSVIDNYR